MSELENINLILNQALFQLRNKKISVERKLELVGAYIKLALLKQNS